LWQCLLTARFSVADNGLVLLMWVGLSASPEWVRNVLGVASVAQIDIDKVSPLKNESYAHRNKTFCLLSEFSLNFAILECTNFAAF